MTLPVQIENAHEAIVDEAAEFILTPFQSILLWSLVVPVPTSRLLSRFACGEHDVQKAIQFLKARNYVWEVDGVISLTVLGENVSEALQQRTVMRLETIFRD